MISYRGPHGSRTPPEPSITAIHARNRSANMLRTVAPRSWKNNIQFSFV